MQSMRHLKGIASLKKAMQTSSVYYNNYSGFIKPLTPCLHIWMYIGAADKIQWHRYLVEAPPNICTPTHIAQAAEKVQQAAPDVFSIEVLEKEECEKMNMGCYLGVSECSEEPPKFIHLTYKSPGQLPCASMLEV